MTKFKTTTVKWKDEEDAKLFASGNVDEDGFVESDNDVDVDEQKAHSNLISDISKISKRKRMAPAPRNVRATVEDGGTRINRQDILKRIGQKDLANAVKKISTLPKPQEKVVLRRLKRTAGYEKVSVESEKWSSLVQHRRTTDQLTFPLQLPDVRVHTALKAEETKMKTPLEQEVYSLLLGAKMMEDKKETEEEMVRKRAMSLEELKERSRLAWKLKAERRKMEYKAWQQNKNKSRKFHRLLRRDRLRKQRAELEQLEKTNPEVALEKLEELERARVEERMTLRHKQSKWAHLQGFRATRDEKAMSALKENQDMHQELLTKRKRQESSSEDEEENIEEKLEALKKERQAAIEAGLFDPTNPWTANLLQQLPERLQVTPDSAIDDSFVNFKKFWDEVNRRRQMEKKAQAIAEAKKQELMENGANNDDGDEDDDSDNDEKMGVADDKGDDDVADDNEEEDDKDSNTGQENGEKDNTEKEETKTKKVKTASHKESVEMEAAENIDKKSKKRKVKSNKKGKNKKLKTSDNKTQQEKEEESKDLENIDDNEDMESKAVNEIDQENLEMGDRHLNKTKKGKVKKKKVIGCKSIKKSNVKSKDKEKKKKASNKIKSGEKKDSKETVNNEDTQSEEMKNIDRENVSGKKKKKVIKKQNEEKKEDVETVKNKSKTGKKKSKGNKTQSKTKENEDSSKEENDKSKKQNDKEKKDSSEANEKVKEKKEDKDLSDNDIDIEEQLISIDNMFNQAELGLQKKLNKKLERLGIKKNASQEWTKVTSKKDKKMKKDTEKSEKSILPKIEEYEFKLTKNQENTDEKMERAKTLEDMDKLQNAAENEDQVLKAAKTLKAAANKETTPGKASDSDKKQAPPKIVQVDPSKFIEVDAKKLLTAMPDTISRGDEAMDDDDEEDEAEDIIREAFADDYLVDEFKSEKDAAREQDKPKSLSLALPGWGNWTGPNIKMSNRIRKRFTIKAPKAPPRKDDTLGNVIYDEKADVHDNLRKAMVSELPFPYSSVKEFEASIRAPIGRLFVPEKQHQNLTAPPLVTKIGTVIEPMTEEALLKHEERLKVHRKKEEGQRDHKQTGVRGKKATGNRGKKIRGFAGKKQMGNLSKKKSS